MSSHIDLGANDAVDIFKGRMDFAKTIGSKFIISNTSKFQFQSKFYNNIKILAEYAEDIDLIIAIENPGHGKDDLFGCGLDAIKIVQELESEFVKINYDVGNIHTYNLGKVDILSDLMSVIPIVAHLHLKDMADFGNGWQFCGIGKGLIDWKSVINLIMERAPDIPLALEIPLRLRRPNYSDPTRIPERISLSVIEQELKSSLEFVNGLLKDV
jgi:sugar phosphate isomerase/epimerase